MSFVTNILTPIIQLAVYMFMGGGVLYFVYRGLKHLFPDLKWILKYKIFRSKYKENDVEWCLDAVKTGYDEVAMKKILLIDGQSKKKVSELLYITKQVQKLKGGGKDGR